MEDCDNVTVMMIHNLFFIIIISSFHRCQSETELTKKRELVFSPPPGGATGTVVYRLEATRILSPQRFGSQHLRVPSPMIGQYTLESSTNSIRDTGISLFWALCCPD